jgi:hypothetical protein
MLADAQRDGRRTGPLLLTSEVQIPVAAAPLLHPRARFCYATAVPPWLRLDRFEQDCVTLLEYRVGP